MKNLITKFACLILILFIAVFFSYRQWSLKHPNVNPINDYQKNTINSEHPLLILDNVTYTNENLPLKTQYEIFKENQAHHEKINAILKEFSIRSHAAHAINAKISNNELPQLTQFINSEVKPEMIEQLYQKNKKLFPKDHDPVKIKTNLAIDVFADKVYTFFEKTLTSLYASKSISLPSLPPAIPADLLNFDYFPKLGTHGALNQLIVLGNYTCPNCTQLNRELTASYNKLTSEKLEVTYVPYGVTDKINSYINRSALCVFSQSLDSFWKFHIQLIENSSMLQKYVATSNMIDTKALINKMIKAYEITSPQFEDCLNGKDANIINAYNDIDKKINFLPISNYPVFILNGRKLDLEGRTLEQALDQWATQ